MTARAWIATVALAVLPGCEAVPTLTFEDGEGGAGDAGDAAGTNAASSDAGCPGVPPPGAYRCCGAIPCYNPNCSDAACSDCLNRCQLPQFCCSRSGGTVSCFTPSNTTCH